jgi:hypothetical protein
MKEAGGKFCEVVVGSKCLLLKENALRRMKML